MTPSQRYQADLQQVGFHKDPGQARAVEYLQVLYNHLIVPVRPPGLFDKLLKKKTPQIMGLYLWGGVGRGKTYLMDCFYESLPLGGKQRVHFHRFMRGIHDELKTLPKTPDPLPIVAGRVAEKVRVLCLDEFHVHDIGDAMLLSGFLKALFENGVTLVTTSNIAPDDLYKNGLQRERFLPAIALIKAHTHELHINDGRDYRLELLEKGGTFHVASGEESEQLLEKQYEQLATNAGERNSTLEINNRTIDVRAIADDVVWFDFNAICATPRSASDYLEIARMFHTVLINDIPVLGEATDDVAQRFIHLVDALYDHNVKLVVTSAATPSELYSGGRHAFSFERTVSRLQEMACQRYLTKAHRS